MGSEKGVLLWFTGIPASGKSTIGGEVEGRLRALGQNVENLDADEVRASISPDLKYTEADRDLNTKRLAYIGRLLTRNGTHTIVAAVSSRRSHRDRAREWTDRFFECHVKTSVEECRRRDPKGLYARADRGEVNDIAGVHMPYEEPESPELVVETDGKSVSECVDMVMAELESRGWIPRAEGATVEGGVYTRHDEERIKARLKKLGYL
jgi:adenylyl-sulfate kinase